MRQGMAQNDQIWVDRSPSYNRGARSQSLQEHVREALDIRCAEKHRRF